MKVSEVRTGAPDAAGKTVEEVYAKYEPSYAVYRTKERVLVHFADDADEQKAQRSSLATLNPLRGEINGQIDGWRASKDPKRISTVQRIERRVADALVVALEADVPDALLLLQAIKADLLDERRSNGRIQYLLVACGAVAVALALIGIFSQDWGRPRTIHGWTTGQLLWLAAAAGAAGAFFSVATAVRGRTVLTDLRFRDNAADAALRIVVGVIGAPVLICLFLSNAATLTLGAAHLSANGRGPNDWLIILVVAFVAGFLERLVPDLLAKSVAAGAATPSPSETMPGAKAAADAAGAARLVASGVTARKAPDDDAIDGCATGIEPDPSQTTGDAKLPAAVGG